MPKNTMTLLLAASLIAMTVISTSAQAADASLDYRIIATSKTSTMEKELNEGGDAGFRFSKVMGGKSANGGHEVIAAMVKDGSPSSGKVSYKLLATNKTSTMQKELQRAAEEGYNYLEQTVFETAFSGREIVVIMERDPSKKDLYASYRILATTKTSTMQKELQEAGAQGYVLLGLTIGKTELGGEEVVTILGRH